VPPDDEPETTIDTPSAVQPAAEPVPESVTDSVSDPATDPGTDSAARPAPTRPRRRAASRPAGPPQPTDAAGETGPDTPPAPDASEAAAPKRRTRKKAVTPVEPDATEAAAANPAAEQPAQAEAPAPRRRARKKVAEPVPDTTSAQGPQNEVAPNEVPQEEPHPEADEQPGAPVFAAPMPLFQAPAPVTAPTNRRRRAASRPAGPPSAEELEEPVAEPVDGAEAAAGSATAADAVSQIEDDEDGEDAARRPRRRRGGRGRRGRSRTAEDGEASEGDDEDEDAPAGETTEGDGAADGESDGEDEEGATGSRRRRRRRRRGSGGADASDTDPPNTVTRVRETRRRGGADDGRDVTGVRGSTRLEAKKQRRREGREAGRRRPIITEAEFLARRESVDRVMLVRERDGRTQIGVLEDGVLVEHYVARRTQTSMVGNVYLGRVQNVLPSMEAAFVDIGKGRNAVLYAGEVNWDAAGLDGQPKRIEHALKSGESVLVQVTKDPIGHKGARLTSQISLPGRYLVYVPEGSMTGISRKLPDTERARLKRILRDVVPEDAGVIVRTAAEGASEDELRRDVARLTAQWQDIDAKATAVNAPALLYGEPDLAIRVVRDIFNEDFASLVVSGEDAWETLHAYIGHVAPDLVERMQRWDPAEEVDGAARGDVFAAYRVDEQLAKALDRKVWLPSGGSLVIDRTEAMTVVDVNTGKFTGAGGNLEETVTKNNVEAAEEIVRQLRLRDIGGIIVVDFIDMVLESNRELVLRRLLECLGRDRTKHQVAEVTSLGLVQMTRKRVGQGLLEVFSETCEACGGRGLILHDEPVEKRQQDGGSGSGSGGGNGSSRSRSRGRRGGSGSSGGQPSVEVAAG